MIRLRPHSPLTSFARPALSASSQSLPLHPGRRRRAGITLLEVIVALTIFLISIVAIGSLITSATDRARDVQWQTQALFLCQGKLAEVTAGVEPLSSQAETPFPSLPDWLYSIDCGENGEVSGLWDVTVRVWRPRADGSRVEVSLSQLVLDPSLRGSSSALSAAASTSASNSGGR